MARWLGGKALLYVLLVAVVLAGPKVVELVSREWVSPTEVAAQIERSRTRAQANLVREAEDFRRLGSDRLDQELTRTRDKKERVEDQLADCDGWLDNYRPSRILECKQLQVRASYLDNRIAALRAAREAAQAESKSAQLGRLRLSQVPSQAQIELAQRRCAAADESLKNFSRRDPLEQWARNLWREERARLERARQDQCSARDRLKRRLEEASARNQRLLSEYRNAREIARRKGAWSVAQVEAIEASTDRTEIRSALWTAAWILLLILLSPLLIRTLLYWVIAPMVARRGMIRLRVPLSDTPIPLPPSSAPSVAVTLQPSEELLVRQGFLQTTSAVGAKRTRWLLSWRRPLSSLAAGLSFLTAVRGGGETSTVSAVHDPFAEVTLFELPDGAACVLQPRALAAVVQPIEQPLRITSHWRLLSLSGWLTGQLRFLVFHGPARLVLKGSRGIRVEPAGQGRIFSQDQVVGFSAGLNYTVNRNETFAPYLLGREPLLKDRIGAGGGVLVIEEAPLAGRGGGAHRRRGLEGMMDGVLKLFGI